MLDHVLGIAIDYETFPVRNLHALSYLPRGLHNLALTMRYKEIEEIETWNSIAPEPIMVNMPGHYGREVASLFNWFSSSLCNYLRLIALIDIATKRKWDTGQISRNADTVKQHCARYTKEVAPEVKAWRDKIAAHPALTDPRKDNVALLEFSVLDSFAFANRRFVAGSIRWVSRGHDSNMQSWSLTEVYERLAPRLWPNVTLPSLPEPMTVDDESQ